MPGAIHRRSSAARACTWRWTGQERNARRTPEAPPLEGPPGRIAASLSEFAEAGADEAILVVSPITERSIRQLGVVLAMLR